MPLTFRSEKDGENVAGQEVLEVPSAWKMSAGYAEDNASELTEWQF